MQKFSNNAQTTINANLAIDGTSITVVDSDSFVALGAGDFELVTFYTPTTLEIVKVTARSGITWTIERAQEGTTAQIWPNGSKVESRITAGTLTNFVQDATLDDYTVTTGLPTEVQSFLDTDYADVAALDSAGDARGTNALNLQSGRANVNEVASGTNSIALGYASRAEGTDTVSMGNNARTFHDGDVAIGLNANTFNAPAAVSIGKNSVVSSTQGVAIGDGASCAGDTGVALGDAASVTAVDGIAIRGTAGGAYSIAIGGSAIASCSNGIAMGKFATVTTGSFGYSMAIGWGTKANGDYNSIAFGAGSAAYKPGVMALNGSRMVANPSISWNGFAMIPQDDWWDGYERGMSGCQAAFATPYVELGVPPTWVSEAAYQHGQIVQPTTGGTVQYRAWLSRLESGLRPVSATATTTEPTWPGAGDSVGLDTNEDHNWIGIDWSAGYATDTIPEFATFFPTEIAFLCRHYEATTGTPTISVGISTDADLFLNAVNIDITAAPQIQRFTLANPNAGIAQGESLLITVNSFASAGRIYGQFLISGYFVENPTHE